MLRSADVEDILLGVSKSMLDGLHGTQGGNNEEKQGKEQPRPSIILPDR
jgi:hypothetical protein